MEDNRNDAADRVDEFMLPGFRFHPTDEELVGFYLKKKIQKQPLSIELIKHVDIYKYDPWDLPKLATAGEKEWYFYCPRDRKYRNSARPNRVTGAGFWKATGTDRAIYSSEGSKCIGLKKSLVFYKGRAAKGMKTDWMMHEFRLPSLANTVLSKDKNIIPPNDSWAICRIFKKANSNAQKALSHSWFSSTLPETIASSDMLNPHLNNTQFSSTTMPASSLIQYSSSSNNNLQNRSNIANFSPTFDLPPYKPYNQMITTGYSFYSPETINHTTKSNTDTVDTNDISFDFASSIFEDFNKASECLDYSGIQEQYVNNEGLMHLPQQAQENIVQGGTEAVTSMEEHGSSGSFFDDEWGSLIRSSIGFPYTMPMSMMQETWKSDLVCDTSPSPADQISTTNKCNN